MTIGSIEGDGNVFLGANNLTVGSNNLSTTFSGGIEGTGGSLTKIGSGTLILSGANTASCRWMAPLQATHLSIIVARSQVQGLSMAMS
jgi:hypothetical protein